MKFVLNNIRTSFVCNIVDLDWWTCWDVIGILFLLFNCIQENSSNRIPADGFRYALKACHPGRLVVCVGLNITNIWG